MKILQFGIIGLGHFGKHYVRLLPEIPGVKLVKTSNTSAETDEIINNKEIDCVVIATPPSTHCEIILKSLRAGKHVLVEKPMVLSVAEAKKVEKELKKNKSLVFMVGFQYIYNDSIRYIKNRISELGTVKYLMGENLYCGLLRADVGSFMDAGIHDLAVVEYLFSPGKIVKISGASRSFNSSAKDDFTGVTVKFQSGLTAHLITSWYWPEKVRKVTLVGDKGMVLFNDREEVKLKWIKNSYPVRDGNKSTLPLSGVIDQPVVPIVTAREPLRNELEHFIECINTNSRPLTGIEFGSKVTKMMEEISKRL
ncbi:MAG: oxidoreductase domain-containing protein [Parcubacteria group bacterium Gr01-1014_13]|nr:MAG: oxidoreductase domain-containing protein [Parcubacteria group bacterium Gr01-1014_13]